MEILSKWEPRQWVLRKIRGSWILTWNFPARATNTRNHKHGREPFSNLEKRSGVSDGAYHLQLAQQGDGAAWDALVVIVANNVQRIANTNHWVVDSERALGVARALVAKELGKITTENDMAIIAGISRQNWYKTWRNRMDDLRRQTIQPLVAEINS